MTERRLTNSGNRMRACVLFLTSVTVAVFATGCTQVIPCRANLRLDIPAAQKRTDEVTIRMTDELRRLDVTIRPAGVKIPLAMSYKFQIGKSLEGNLTSALQDLFRATRVSSLPMSDLASAPFVLETDLVSYDIKIGITIFSSHTAKLVIRYSVYQTGRRVFTLETNTDGTSSMRAGEVWGRVLIPGRLATRTS